MTFLRRVRFQPDYFMSSQFAGVAVALRGGAYERNGLDVEILPVGRAGEHAEEISIVARDTGDSLIVGSTEQNILIPEQRKHGAPVQAVAAMFGVSPLAFAALPGRQPWVGGEHMRLGVHEDTIPLAQRLLPHAEVVGVGREEKMGLLTDGQVDAIQVYDVMETLKLEHDLGALPSVLPLEGLGGARLGYAQVLFASDASLRDTEHRQSLCAFLKATFEGWREAARNPASAAKLVMELMPHQTDHWVHSLDFHTSSVARCCDYVRRARCAGVLGVINPLQWSEASDWLGGSGGRPSLDATLWATDPLLADGDSVAARILQDVTERATAVTVARNGQQPTLGLVTVGHTALGHTSDGATDRESLAPNGQSWFNKAEAGRRHGVAVEQIDLPSATSTHELVRTLRGLVRRCDGIQLMWPLPAHIDTHQAYSAVPPALDIDGAHFIGSSELRGSSGAAPSSLAYGGEASKGCWMPVTPAAVLRLLTIRGIPLSGRHAVVIGRSRIVGSPLAHALLQANMTVTVAHSHCTSLATLCHSADVVVSSAGVPGLVRGAWIKPGAAVVSVGTTFCVESSSLISDLEADLEAFRHAALVSTAPGGVGPLSLAMLLCNVVESAEGRVAKVGANEGTLAARAGEIDSFLGEHPEWSLRKMSKEKASLDAGDKPLKTSGSEVIKPPKLALVRCFQLSCHHDAADLISTAGELGDSLDHHIALAAVEHRCVEGVQLTVHAYTTSTGDVTKHDLRLATSLEKAYNEKASK